MQDQIDLNEQAIKQMESINPSTKQALQIESDVHLEEDTPRGSFGNVVHALTFGLLGN